MGHIFLRCQSTNPAPQLGQRGGIASTPLLLLGYVVDVVRVSLPVIVRGAWQAL